MAFVKKTWKDRIAEFPTRRRLTKEDNTSELVTVAREEGTLSQEGDAFSAENMNDLENRIDAEFTEVNGKLNSMVTSVGIIFDSHYGTIISHNLCIVNGYLIGCFSLNVTQEIPSGNQCLALRKDAQNVSFKNRIDITLQSDVIKRMVCLPPSNAFYPNGATIPVGFYIGYICAKTIE